MEVRPSYSVPLLVLPLFLWTGCPADPAAVADDDDAAGDDDDSATDDDDDSSLDGGDSLSDPDTNGDGALDILILGSSTSIRNHAEAFSPGEVASQLEDILQGDGSLDLDVRVVAEDLHMTADVVTGYGQAGGDNPWSYYSHSLAQYYYWPQGRQERLDDLAGNGAVDWDHVVFAGDPHIVATMPGWLSLGLARVSRHVDEGGARTWLLMVWPRDEGLASIEHFAEFTHRAADGAPVDVGTIPAALAWDALDSASQDQSVAHPTPDGAYISAATFYSQLTGRSAAQSSHDYDDVLAEVAKTTVDAQVGRSPHKEPRDFVSPFQRGEATGRTLAFNHTGTSSENGILRGLRWVLERARVPLRNGGDPPIEFNYGRANTEFEPGKRYRVDPAAFDYSLGFPMQDHSNHGDTSMLYGLDRRRYETENGTDLGVARFMRENSELPQARAVPIRVMLATMMDAVPGQSGYSDGWHMDHDLDKATGAYMFTLLTGHCAVGDEPADPDSGEWASWYAHKTGYETAWNLMHLSGRPPCLRVLPESEDSTWISGTQQALLDVSFGAAPTADVTVTLSVDDPNVAAVEPSELTFGTSDFGSPRTVTLTGVDGAAAGTVTLHATTSSGDRAFDGITVRWEYEVRP